MDYGFDLTKLELLIVEKIQKNPKIVLAQF